MKNWMLAVCAMAAVGGAQAHCDKPSDDLLKFLVPYAATNFAAIRGDAAGGGQYHLTPEAEQVCPNVFILEDAAAHDKYPEFWEVKYTSSQTGTQDDVGVSVIKAFSPVLKAAGFQEKPYLNDGDDPGSWQLEWDGPSDTWVTVDSYQDDDRPGVTSYEVRVAHNVK